MDFIERLEKLKMDLDIDQKRSQLSELQRRLEDPEIWSKPEEAKTINQKISTLNNEIQEYIDIEELSEIATPKEQEELLPRIEELEHRIKYMGPHDASGAFLEIFSGAGGVDAQDWAEMVLKMYLDFAQNDKSKLKNGKWDTDILEINYGAEAGIKNATVHIKGHMVYGNLKGEVGVHRLVRLSPYNAKNLRQTSFALVEIIPEIENPKEVEIEEKDLKIDVYRASGKGGQSVNTTDSAVRLTHIPTGIVVTCQNERSQLQNRETAMKILKSRLKNLLEKTHKQDISDLKGESKSNEWGSQIRSYVMHPYKLVKDHRTGYETSDVESVLNGGIEGFIKSYQEKQTESGN